MQSLRSTERREARIAMVQSVESSQPVEDEETQITLTQPDELSLVVIQPGESSQPVEALLVSPLNLVMSSTGWITTQRHQRATRTVSESDISEFTEYLRENPHISSSESETDWHSSTTSLNVAFDSEDDMWNPRSPSADFAGFEAFEPSNGSDLTNISVPTQPSSPLWNSSGFQGFLDSLDNTQLLNPTCLFCTNNLFDEHFNVVTPCCGQCGHTFHDLCLNRYIFTYKNKNCPLCGTKCKIDEINQEAGHRLFFNF